MKRASSSVVMGMVLLFVWACVGAAAERKIPKRGTRLRGPKGSLKNIVAWEMTCKEPEGMGLAFGGHDQRADDGRPHTRVWQEGKWVPIHEELRKKNPLQPHHREVWTSRTRFKDAIGRARYIFFEGRTPAQEQAFLNKEVNPVLRQLSNELTRKGRALSSLKGLNGYQKGQVNAALKHIKAALPMVVPFKGITQPDLLAAMRQAQVKLEQAAACLDAEPPPRVCSKLRYDSKTKQYVIFGGDHFDYLSNDVWVFDPTNRKWEQRHPQHAPEPRAHFSAETPGDGTLHVWAGYLYKSSISYMGPAYEAVGGGEWVYDIQKNQWKGPEGDKTFPPNTRSYRSGPYAPEYYMKGERPNAAANEARLKAIPVNTWVEMKPPLRYQLNRDWGTTVIDTDHDLLLQWSGGHSAYGGTDVAQYHVAANRWSLPFPAELPIGDAYANSSYPGGFNFNRRPWMTGHTYKGYAYSPELKRMVLVVRTHQWEFAHDPYFYLYDPLIGEWTGRHRKHSALCKVKNMYSTIVCHTPHGTAAWAHDKLLLLNNAAKEWKHLKLKGKIPRVAVDASGMLYDPKRERFLVVRSAHYKKPDYDGQIHAVDMKELTVTQLSPKDSKDAFGAFVREGVYHSGLDLFIWGRRGGGNPLIIYNPTENRWKKVETKGKAPFGFSTGHMYDSKRQLLWVVDNRARVFCLRVKI